MHIHHNSLKQINQKILFRLKGAVLAEAFSQDKNELVLGFGLPDEDLWLRISCASPLPYIWPIQKFHKARRNYFDLFEEVLGKKLINSKVVKADRVLVLNLESGFQLILKMHGLKSNVILKQNGTCVSIFRNNFEEDRNYVPASGDFDEDWKSNLPESEGLTSWEKLNRISPIYDRQIAKRVDELVLEGHAFQKALEQVQTELEAGRYYLSREKNRIRFSLLPQQADGLIMEDLSQALSTFFRSWFQLNAYTRDYAQANRLLTKHLRRYNGQLNSYYKSIDQIQNERPAEEIGHIIMANLHQIQVGLEKVELFDFYQDQNLVVKLRPELNPQQNAERYYKKQKKLKSRVKHLEIQIERLEEEKSAFDEVDLAFQELPDPAGLKLTERGFDYEPLKNLQAFSKRWTPLLKAGKPRLVDKKHPFLEFRKSGYAIFVGKNARQNDRLTFQFSKKNDLWMHVRDAQGSHVIIRNSSSQTVPKDVIEYAASLAALYSKRKREQLVPVQYAERKYIRKVRNGHPGQVIVTREKVVMVEPAVLG